MDKPRLYVDFNEMFEPDLTLLSQKDIKTDSGGNLVTLTDGLGISIYSDDMNHAGARDNLVAEGIVEPNKQTTGWSALAKWCCRIKGGIKHESELLNKEDL